MAVQIMRPTAAGSLAASINQVPTGRGKRGPPRSSHLGRSGQELPISITSIQRYRLRHIRPGPLRSMLRRLITQVLGQDRPMDSIRTYIAPRLAEPILMAIHSMDPLLDHRYRSI